MARKSPTLTLVTSSPAAPKPQANHAPTPGLLATMALLGGFDKELPPPPASPDIRQVALRDISPGAYQPRRFQVPDAEDSDLFRLASSIRRGGVLQPILLRPHATGGGFELVAGERRYRASCLQSPELDAIGPAPLYIPALVRELTDQEAHAIAVTENLLRKDLHPLEEAEGVASLLLLMREDADAVARSIGQTRSWVACRARIHTHLLDDFKDLFASNTSLRGWTVGHLEEVAKLAPDIQREVLTSVQHGGYYGDLTVTRLRSWLAGFTMKLSDAPFPLEDETLHPQAGACTTCPFHTLAAPHLFEDQGDDPQGDLRKARCLNSRCWQTKRQSFLDRRRDELRASHPDLRLAATSFEDLPTEWRRDGVLRPTDYTKLKKRTKDAMPAMVAAGPRGGELIWIKAAQPEKTAAASSGSSETEAQTDRLSAGRERLRRRRLARIAILATEMLEAHDGSAVSSNRLMASVSPSAPIGAAVWSGSGTRRPGARSRSFAPPEARRLLPPSGGRSSCRSWPRACGSRPSLAFTLTTTWRPKSGTSSFSLPAPPTTRSSARSRVRSRSPRPGRSSRAMSPKSWERRPTSPNPSAAVAAPKTTPPPPLPIRTSR